MGDKAPAPCKTCCNFNGQISQVNSIVNVHPENRLWLISGNLTKLKCPLKVHNWAVNLWTSSIFTLVFCCGVGIIVGVLDDGDAYNKLLRVGYINHSPYKSSRPTRTIIIEIVFKPHDCTFILISNDLYNTKCKHGPSVLTMNQRKWQEKEKFCVMWRRCHTQSFFSSDWNNPSRNVTFSWRG